MVTDRGDDGHFHDSSVIPDSSDQAAVQGLSLRKTGEIAKRADPSRWLQPRPFRPQKLWLCCTQGTAKEHGGSKSGRYRRDHQREEFEKSENKTDERRDSLKSPEERRTIVTTTKSYPIGGERIACHFHT
ncbi:MAG: hypothetical protein ABW003_18855 [Microvirga sp.]